MGSGQLSMYCIDVALHAQICHTSSVVYNSFAKNLVQKSWIISLLDVLVCGIAE